MVNRIPPDNSENNPMKVLSELAGKPADFLTTLAPKKIRLVPSNPLPSGREIITDQRSPHQIRSNPHPMAESLLLNTFLLSIFPPIRVFLSYDPHPQSASLTEACAGVGWIKLEAKSSILEAAPLRTILPTHMAWVSSFSSAPHSFARLMLISRQGWQLAATEAPTAIRRIKCSSNFIRCSSFHLLAIMIVYLLEAIYNFYGKVRLIRDIVCHDCANGLTIPGGQRKPTLWVL
jgi:hypothetical protein